MFSVSHKDAVISTSASRHGIKPKLPKVVALVPAYNEEVIIQRTIESLMIQTLSFDYVLIVANNCTDRTVEIVQDMQLKYGENLLRMLIMVNNPFKKAGALNYGFEELRKDEDIDYVFSMDSDTILDHKILEEGVKKLVREPYTGGVCSAYRALPLAEGSTAWQRILWRQQNIEFGLANAWRVENSKSARVLPGVSVLYRMDALLSISKLRDDRTVWATNHLVEDYRLTLELKDLGWETKSSIDMVSWSDVPLKLRGKGGLWEQRQRWYSGTVDEIRLRRFKQHSRYELFTIVLLMVNLLMRCMLYGSYTLLLLEGKNVQLLSYFLVLPVITVGMQLYRLKYCDQLDKWQIIMTATLVVNEIYAIYRELLYCSSIYVSIFRPNRQW